MSRSQNKGRHKGMVSLDGVTYRIERLASRNYAVVRLNDDVPVGTFKTGKEIRVFPDGVDAVLLEAIARDAIKSAKTSWVSHPVPSPPPPEPESAPDAIEPPRTSRRGWAPA